MTSVAFHTGLEDPVGYACRLLRKAARQGVRVLVSAGPPTLDVLDKALWTFDAQDFVPHLRLRPGQPAGAAQARTPVWLVDPESEQQAAADGVAVLVRLGVTAPCEVVAVDRVIELVGLDDEERRLARQRWRAYEAQGIPVQHHPVAAQP